VIGDLRDREVVGPHLFGEFGLAQTFEAEIELGHGKALSTQGSISSSDQLNGVSEPALAQPAQHRAALGQEREMPHIVGAITGPGTAVRVRSNTS
jgi:hypothetical protein